VEFLLDSGNTSGAIAKLTDKAAITAIILPCRT
jgi:hypothetical protein